MPFRWAGVDDASDDEEEDADEVAAAAKSKESAAERSARINAEIKSNLTAILLDVTDAIFGACCISSLPPNSQHTLRPTIHDVIYHSPLLFRAPPSRIFPTVSQQPARMPAELSTKYTFDINSQPHRPMYTVM